MRTLQLFPLTLALTLLSSPLLAGEHWIDPVQGSDANTGDSPGSAWRTVTHALGVLGTDSGEEETLNLLPGTYDVNSGEAFPLQLRPELELHGLEGSMNTHFVGQAGVEVFTAVSGNITMQPVVRVQGLTLSGGSIGFSARAFLPGIVLELEDLVLEGNDVGLQIDSSPVGGSALLSASKLQVRGNGTGMSLRRSIQGTFEGCTIEQNSGTGVELLGQGGNFGSSTVITLRRVRLQDNGGNGLAASSTGTNASVSWTLEDSLVARNQGDGIEVRHVFGGHLAAIHRNSVADNGGRGLFLEGATEVTSMDNILFGNAVDLAGDLGGLTSTNDWVGMDPHFVDAPAGDYRLAYGSPCVDSAQTGAGFGDLLGRLRDVDGDGDTLRSGDRGALELVTLDSVATVGLDEEAVFELFGAQGERSLVYFRRGLPLAGPLTTPFGEFHLPSNGIRTFGTVNHTPGPGPTVFALPIPDSPAYLGQVFTFQAISSSPVAPAGAAATTPTTLRVE